MHGFLLVISERKRHINFFHINFLQQVLNLTPLNPAPAMPQAKTEVALQFLECCAAETALQHWLFCNAEVTWTKSCAAANEKLHCNIEKAALQESGAFLPLSCGFQAPTFRHPRFGPADFCAALRLRDCPWDKPGLSQGQTR